MVFLPDRRKRELLFLEQLFELVDVGLFQRLGDELHHVAELEGLLAVFGAVGAGEHYDLGLIAYFLRQTAEIVQE